MITRAQTSEVSPPVEITIVADQGRKLLRERRDDYSNITTQQYNEQLPAACTTMLISSTEPAMALPPVDHLKHHP